MTTKIIVSLLVLAGAAAIFAQDVLPTGPGAPTQVRFVTVTNWPDSQTIDGLVKVENLPDVYLVSGTVDIGNLPAVQQVEVVNLGAGSSPQLVGFTADTYPADTGVLGFLAACQAEFPGSRMCLAEDFLHMTVQPDLSAAPDFAWVGGRDDCAGWGDAGSAASGTIFSTYDTTVGGLVGSNCLQVFQAACCLGS